jgi:hypothetical protein
LHPHPEEILGDVHDPVTDLARRITPNPGRWYVVLVRFPSGNVVPLMDADLMHVVIIDNPLDAARVLAAARIGELPFQVVELTI